MRGLQGLRLVCPRTDEDGCTSHTLGGFPTVEESYPLKPIHSLFDIPKEKWPAIEKRFWAKVEKTDGCWLWKGSLSHFGYGHFTLASLGYGYCITIKPHRLVYELTKGTIPEGKTLDHLCRNRACVNPHHLEPITNRENLIRGNGFAGQNVRKTHCSNGHALVEGNLVPHELKRGHRVCMICTRRYAREHYAEFRSQLVGSPRE